MLHTRGSVYTEGVFHYIGSVNLFFHPFSVTTFYKMQIQENVLHPVLGSREVVTVPWFTRLHLFAILASLRYDVAHQNWYQDLLMIDTEKMSVYLFTKEDKLLKGQFELITLLVLRFSNEKFYMEACRSYPINIWTKEDIHRFYEQCEWVQLQMSYYLKKYEEPSFLQNKLCYPKQTIGCLAYAILYYAIINGTNLRDRPLTVGLYHHEPRQIIKDLCHLSMDLELIVILSEVENQCYGRIVTAEFQVRHSQEILSKRRVGWPLYETKRETKQNYFLDFFKTAYEITCDFWELIYNDNYFAPLIPTMVDDFSSASSQKTQIATYHPPRSFSF